MAFGYTKGEWAVNFYRDCLVCDNRIIIAERPHSGIGKDDFERNAELMAAAPAMHKVLKNLNRSEDWNRLSDENQQAILSALHNH